MSQFQPPVTGIQILSVPLAQSPALTEDLRGLLDAEERRRADAFCFETDRRRWTISRAALRIALGRRTGTAPERVAIAVNSHGKPHLAQTDAVVHFNLSHSGNHALIVLADHGPVGIDIERTIRGNDLIDCAKAFLSPAELSEADAISQHVRAERFLRIWCAKEAYLKALGTGLGIPPEMLILEKRPDGIFLITECGRQGRFGIHFPDPESIPGFIAAAALPLGQFCPPIEPINLFDEDTGKKTSCPSHILR